MLFNTKVPCSVASVALLCKLPQFYINLKNLSFAMNEKNGIGESKVKKANARENPVESLAVGKVLR